MGSLEEKLTWKIFLLQLPFMHAFKYLKQRVRIIGEWNGKSFKGVSKTNKEHMKRLPLNSRSSFCLCLKQKFCLYRSIDCYNADPDGQSTF